jgi:hypothetical protein
VDISIIKDEEYQRIFSDNQLEEDRAKAQYKEILVRSLLSLSIANIE